MTEQEKTQFIKTVQDVSGVELFDLYAEYAQSDDWDGSFTAGQIWKRETCAVELTARLHIIDKANKS